MFIQKTCLKSMKYHEPKFLRKTRKDKAFNACEYSGTVDNSTKPATMMVPYHKSVPR